MPRYFYKALNSSRKMVEETVEAGSRKELAERFRNLALVPLEVREETVAAAGSHSNFLRFSGKHVSRKQITQFTTQLSALINAKMNLAKALKALEKQSTGEAMAQIISALFSEVEKGKNLSDALEDYPEYFSPLYVNMIRVGEVGGVLDKSLERLVDMRTKDEDLIGKVKGALTYPCIMALVMIGSIVVMLTFVIPKFSGVFTQMGTSLPFSTRVVLGLSEILKEWWWLIIIIGTALSFAGYFLARKDKNRMVIDRLKLRFPVFGKVAMDLCISRFSLAMGALLGNGVSMMKALDSTVPITGNFFIETTLREVAEEVRQGASLSEALRKRAAVFPALMIGMAGTGEEAGSLDEMLHNVGEYYRKESEEKIGTMTTLLEPIMIVVMGSVVGFIVSAILLPIFDVSTSIH